MNEYNLRGLTPQEMDREENTSNTKRYSPKNEDYIEATLNPKEGTFKVVNGDKVLEKIVIS